MRTTVKTLVLLGLLLSFVIFGKPQKKEMSDAEYMKNALSAAPKAVTDGAKVVRVMVGPPSKALGYTEAKDPDPTKPYMMWAGTPYEHAMIPVGTK